MMAQLDPAGRAMALERYLREHIPISAAMEVRVARASEAEVCLRAPLEPNINHRSTVFGGSAAAVAILAGWSLVHLRTGGDGAGSRIVIQRSTVEYQHPIDADFEAVASAPAGEDWQRFSRMMERRGRGRIDVAVELRLGDEPVGQCTCTYVVLPCRQREGEAVA
jgi:thioesterase domain-containing protein